MIAHRTASSIPWRRPSPSVLVQQLGPETWRIHVPGRYLTTAEGPLERDLALTIASRHARQRYADGYPGDRSEWRSDTATPTPKE